MRRYDIEFVCDFHPHASSFEIDAGVVRSALINILENALKFSSENNQITISTYIDYFGCFIISVQDTGCGIAENNLTNILAPFTRGDDPFVRASEGVGLGLAICLRIMQQHQGKLQIKSTKGEGTTVTITIPAERILYNKP
jgi:signal transduction histidine kinase